MPIRHRHRGWVHAREQPATDLRCTRVVVDGIVQGVGFRPFVYRLAGDHGLTGEVRNAGGRVEIRVAGTAAAVDDFLAGLVTAAPPAARVDHIEVTTLPAADHPGSGFVVADSVVDRSTTAQLPVDLAPCAECLRELSDPADRRYRYPFLNCTQCGPRATVIIELPYDRQRTAMRHFPMCDDCAGEYHDPADRRFHAEPTCCPACGPRLAWRSGEVSSILVGEHALQAACAVLAGGGIVALKGVGGYQLCCDAADDAAVTRLRTAKCRPAKPLAVMVENLTAAAELVLIEEAVATALSEPGAPIVLAPARPGAPVSEAIAPGCADLGVFLPSSALHHLLLAQLRRPLVATSGNRGGAATIVDDEIARRELSPIADGILDHDRPIVTRFDDSVVRAAAGRVTTVRRSRGLAPSTLPLPTAAGQPVLAVGAQLKNTCTLATAALATTGPHLGDLSDAETFTAFEQSVTALCRWSAVRPEVVAHDLHPGYLSTRYAQRHWPATRRLAIQHHHAHVAAVAAEHGVTGTFVGIAFDGLGFGDDGTLWGGEILVADLIGYRRYGRFATAALPGGAAAVRRPARTALGYLHGGERFGAGRSPADPAPIRMTDHEAAVLRTMIDRGLNCPRTSSAGRLFDAVSALLGLCAENTYEGEAAVRLEAAAAGHPGAAALPWTLRRRAGLLVYDPAPTLGAVIELLPGTAVGEIAARFHRTVAEVAVTMAAEAAAAADTGVVCLGGGVFQNARLTTAVLDGLALLGLRGLIGQRVPANDGGVSYGQAAIAAARTRRM
ncbi:carbamoyltransferase HypF [Nocardia sp. alder85J]|uniref:carbamoyltransferase HypF n=1 Tax=Nocardia sp. alder85J TaxID=2862949 RepID=UPI001CD51203|nr:carbamoyltransferase HypF [Nocardia sp. alder85J]MCX4092469.1 carbamoyltransferase HypF [Nocardia sp. alder85J]